MARLPITISRIFEEKRGYREPFKRELNEHYLIEIEERNRKWDITYRASKKDILGLRNDLNELLGFKDLSEKFNCTIEQAEEISNYHETNRLCENCNQKFISCIDCIFTCQSPLEQSLYVALKNQSIDSELQRRIKKDGSGYSKEIPVDKDTILTLPDFYIKTSKKDICIYADGHTYHERTEYQALRDRNIDRELQNLGFVCLRFTGKEIRESIDKVITTIKNSIDKNGGLTIEKDSSRSRNR